MYGESIDKPSTLRGPGTKREDQTGNNPNSSSTMSRTSSSPGTKIDSTFGKRFCLFCVSTKMLQTKLVWRSFVRTQVAIKGVLVYNCATVTKYTYVLFNAYYLHEIYTMLFCFRTEHMVNQTRS